MKEKSRRKTSAEPSPTLYGPERSVPGDLRRRKRGGEEAEDTMRKRVVVDVDAGTDDAVALLLLLALEPQGDFRVVGVTCTHGNASLENVCRNVLTTLESVRRLDIPVFGGAEGPLVPLRGDGVPLVEFHGKNGFGDKNLPPPGGSLRPENAVAALNRLASEEEGIVLVCLGPLTNVALALRTYSGFAKGLREVYLMGGNATGVGNATAAAEFNFYKDPEAAHVVLSTLSCPLTLLPWESCNKNNLTLEERFQVLGSSPRAHVRLLNEIEEHLYGDSEYWIPCDAFLAAVFLDDRVAKESRHVHMSVELHGAHTRGQGVVDHLGRNRPNVRLVDEIDLEVFKDLLFKMVSFDPQP